MTNEMSTTRSSAPNFSLAFRQMASFVAIAKLRATSRVLDELIQQCFVVLPDESLSSADQVLEAMQILFGIRPNLKDVSMALKRLGEADLIREIGNGHLALAPKAADELNARIAAAKSLEKAVREHWLVQSNANTFGLNGDKLWSALLSYLQQAFRRHGIQAVELLNPEVEIVNESKVGLSSILEGVIAKEFFGRQASAARDAISSFFQTVGKDRKRAEYIASLADAAFNYFSLAVAPEVSEELRGKLNGLTLFLDTNFLFGILNLHVNPQVDVSSELLGVIKRFKLPFRLSYHEATVREMSNTLFYFGKELNSQKWPQKMSRAVVTSGALSGIELRYHTKNAVQPISVDDFLAPLQHWQVLLKDKGIDVFRADPSPSRLLARANLEADYKDYLAAIRRDKPMDAIQHDMTVLEAVQSLRTGAKSTLDAGSLLVTCDYNLFRFDVEHSRNHGHHQSAVLPSLLWQILRPFVSDNEEFDRAFAETFALPEFSLGRGGAQRAAARMASILASYSDIPEETAAKMLANDLLIAELLGTRTDAEFSQTVESAVAAENAQLVEERAALAAQHAADKAELESKRRELEDSVSENRQHEQALAERDQTLLHKEEMIQKLQVESATQSQIAEQATQMALREAQENEKIRLQLLKNMKEEAEHADQRAVRISRFLGIIIGLLTVVIFELTVNLVFPWKWLLEHPNGYGLQGCFSLIIFFVILGLIVKSWRKTAVVVGILGAVLVTMQIIGGNRA